MVFYILRNLTTTKVFIDSIIIYKINLQPKLITLYNK